MTIYCKPVYVEKRRKPRCLKDFSPSWIVILENLKKIEESQDSQNQDENIVSLFGIYRFQMPPRRVELPHARSILPRFLFDYRAPYGGKKGFSSQRNIVNNLI